VLLEFLSFNETIALAAQKMGTNSICNITAASLYGHTQGNPKYVVEFASYLVAPPDGELFGGPVQGFDEDLNLSKETTWTLKQPRVPEPYLSYIPADVMDEVSETRQGATRGAKRRIAVNIRTFKREAGS
jgi:hypothetical protein